jgi:hypothetical protein
MACGWILRPEATDSRTTFTHRMSLVEAPRLGREPYKPVVSWGQTAYFDLSVEALRRMAASSKLQLDVRAAGGSTMHFAPTRDTRATLTQYLKARGITDD